MINKTWIIVILAVIIAALIAGFGWWGYSKLKKESNGWKAMYYGCRNAPADTVIKYVSIYLPGATVVKPVPYKIIEHDTILITLREIYYDSVYKNNGWRFRYRMKTYGSLDYIEFSDLVAPKEIVTITRHIDTCIVKPLLKQPTFRIGPYVDLTLNSFSKFPGLGLGGQVIVKDQLTFSVGGLYMDGFSANVRIGWLFKK